MDRKDFLKSLGALTVGATFIGSEQRLKAVERAVSSSSDKCAEGPADAVSGASETDPELDFAVKGLRADVNGKPIRAIIVGAGSRGRTYASYAKRYPECLQIVGVSDIYCII